MTDRATLYHNYRRLLLRFQPDPAPGPGQPVQEPPRETPPVREPDMPKPPGPSPVPGTPSITPQEFPKHPGAPPEPGRQHPADPNPQQPQNDWPIRVLRALWKGRTSELLANRPLILKPFTKH